MSASPPDRATCPRCGYGPHALDEHNVLRCAREIGGGKRCGRAAGEWMPACGLLYPLSRRQRAAEDQR